MNYEQPDNSGRGGYTLEAFMDLADIVARIEETEQRQAKSMRLFPEQGAYREFMKQVHWAMENDPDAARAEAQRRMKYQQQRDITWAKEQVQREKLERRVSGELSDTAMVMRDKLASRILSADDLDDQEDPAPIVEGWLYNDSINWIAGASGTFKSFVAHDLAARFGKPGMSYHGIPMAHGKALYIVAEGAGMFKHRKNAWQHYNGKVENVTYLPVPVQLADFEAQLPALCDIARTGGFDMIVVDTQAMCSVGVDENTAEGMGAIVAAAHSLREVFNGCIVMVHHFGKSSQAGMRGNSALYAAANTVIVTKREAGASQVVLSTKSADGGKQKDDEERDDLKFALDPYDPAEHGQLGRKSLCPNRDDGWKPTVHKPLPVLDARQLLILAKTEACEAVGGLTETQIAAEVQEVYPKPAGVWKANNAHTWGATLVRLEVAEKHGTYYRITELGRQCIRTDADQ